MTLRSVMYLRLLLASCLLLQSACGFEPVYANRSEDYETSDMLAAIAIETPPGREGELLRAELYDLLNPESSGASPDFALKAALEMQYEPFIIEPDGTASRFRITFVSPFSLSRIADNTVVGRGTIRRQVSYNVSENDDYSTFVAQQDAVRRGLAELAEDYKMRLGALMSAGKKP
jgi:LPS-assembly lipoprotein